MPNSYLTYNITNQDLNHPLSMHITCNASNLQPWLWPCTQTIWSAEQQPDINNKTTYMNPTNASPQHYLLCINQKHHTSLQQHTQPKEPTTIQSIKLAHHSVKQPLTYTTNQTKPAASCWIMSQVQTTCYHTKPAITWPN